VPPHTRMTVLASRGKLERGYNLIQNYWKLGASGPLRSAFEVHVAYNFLEKSSSVERTNVDVFLAGIEKAFRYPLDVYMSFKAA
jgi:hypothetical protein